MKRLFADTNIFGIAVDRKDERRLSVWKIMDDVASGEIELHTAQIVIKEIKRNPHKTTMEKELDLVENLVTQIHDLDKEARNLAVKLEQIAGLDVVDSQIVALSITNDLMFWSGDRYILREKCINEIKDVLKDYPKYNFKYKKE